MGDWFNRRLEGFLDNAIFSAVIAGGAIVWPLVKSLSTPVIFIIFISVFLVVLLILRFTAKYKSKVKESKAVELKNNLSIGAKLDSIAAFGFYDKALDDGSLKGDKTEGNKLLNIDIILSPVKPMTLDTLALELWGKRFDAEKLPLTTIKETSHHLIQIIVPKDLAVDTKEARIYVLAGNSEWYSEPFPITFGG